MNRVMILEQIRKFGFQAESAPDANIVIEGVPGSLTESEAIAWIENREKTHCPSCGRPWEKK